MPVHNALFLEMKLEKNSYFSTIDTSKANLFNLAFEFMIYYPACEEKYYEMYRIFDIQKQSAKVSISAKSPEKLIDQIYQEDFSVIAYNEYSKSSIDLNLNLIVNGAFIWYNENSQLSIKKEIDYNDHYEIDLSNLFNGQEIEMALNVNDRYVDNQNGILAPAYVNKRTEITGHYNSSGILCHYILISGADIQVITSDGALILTQITKNNSEGISLNLSEIFNADSLKCSLIDNFEHTKNSHTLIVTTCEHKVYSLNDTGIFSMKKLLILWEFDYSLFAIKSYKSLPLGYRPVNLKTLTLDNTNFEILVSESYTNINFEKKILRFRGSWILGDIKLQQVEIISSASLKLPSFRSCIFDGIAADSQTAYWYILDVAYGLRVLKAHENNLEIITGFPIKSLKFFTSIGVCGNYLYIADESLKKYSIKNYSELALIEEYYLNHILTSSYSRVACSADGKYVALYLFNGIGLSVRIIDTSADPSSSHVHDIEINNDAVLSEINEVKFMNLNTFFVVRKHKFLAIQINPIMLYIPKLNESEYNEMIEEWGTNAFDVFLTAKNKDSQANSTVISFRRMPIEKKEKTNSFRLK
ncbi:unnamed protein product [Blepharisma stoltei]|uniref:Uncharacterized protein n=1 Tax=Blepharisma stoltei TaxID=1481888 RepID=A0AAU9I916_9CILI|nr:unnamed protein product [Blepharisma stoltei]